MYSNETRNAYVELVKEAQIALKEIDASQGSPNRKVPVIFVRETTQFVDLVLKNGNKYGSSFQSRTIGMCHRTLQILGRHGKIHGSSICNGL